MTACEDLKRSDIVWASDDETIPCVRILTTNPNDLMNPIHDRMPAVLPRDAESKWLSAGSDARKERCRPYSKDDRDAYEISTRVNNPGNDDPQVIEPLDHEQSGFGEFSSGSFAVSLPIVAAAS